MTNEEINKYIDEQIMKQHRHVWNDPTFPSCDECGAILADRHTAPNPDYCSDASPRSLLNEVVAKVMDINWMTYDKTLKAMATQGNFFAGLVYTASAKQIARACVAAHQEAK